MSSPIISGACATVCGIRELDDQELLGGGSPRLTDRHHTGDHLHACSARGVVQQALPHLHRYAEITDTALDLPAGTYLPQLLGDVSPQLLAWAIAARRLSIGHRSPPTSASEPPGTAVDTATHHVNRDRAPLPSERTYSVAITDYY